MVDTVELSSKHPGKLLVAAGFDTGNKHFSLINFEFVSIVYVYVLLIHNLYTCSVW